MPTTRHATAAVVHAAASKSKDSHGAAMAELNAQEIGSKLDRENSGESSEISDVEFKKSKSTMKSTQEEGTINPGGSVEIVMPTVSSKRSLASSETGQSSMRRSKSGGLDSSSRSPSGSPSASPTTSALQRPPTSSKGSDKPPSGSDRPPISSKGSDKLPTASRVLDKSSSSNAADKASSSKAADKPSSSKSGNRSSPSTKDATPEKSPQTTPPKATAKESTPPKAPVKESTPPKAEKAVERKPNKDVTPKPNKVENVPQQTVPQQTVPQQEKREIAPAPQRSQVAPTLPATSPNEGSPKKDEVAGSGNPSPKSQKSDSGGMLGNRMSSFMRVEHNPLYRDSGCAVSICEHNFFEPVCLLVIVLNAIWIGIELDQRDPDAGPDDTPVYVDIVENVFCGIFSLEILIRLIVYKKPYYFFIDPLKWMWNIFDLSLVLLLVLETWILKYAADGVDLPALSSLRLLRLLRIVRVLRMVPELAMMVKSLVAAIRSVSMTFVLAVGIMYIFSILLTQWARDYVPSTPCDHPINCVDKAFGTISKSFLTLMQILCFDATFSLIRAILDESLFHGLLLILFILIAAFTVLNMLIGVVCEIVAETNTGEREKAMREKVIGLFASLDADNSGYISHEEMKNPEIPAELAKAGIENDVLQSTLKILETRRSAHNAQDMDDGQLELDEFLETIFKLLHPPEAQDILLILRKLERLEKALTDNVVVLPKGKAVGPSAEVQKKIAALQQQVAAMTRHVLEANEVYAGDSASAEFAWDHELRQLDTSMTRLRVRLERCIQEEVATVDEELELPAPSELKHWRLLCNEVVQSLSATADLIKEGLKDHLLEKPIPALTSDISQPFARATTPLEPVEETRVISQPQMLSDANTDLRRDAELRRDADLNADVGLSRGGAPKCPQGHACMFFFTPEDGWVCDSCDTEQAAGTGMWGCRQCEYDFCKDCATLQELGTIEEQQPLQPMQPLQQPLLQQQPERSSAPPVKAPKCPVGHTCELFYTDEAGWTCDMCRREQAVGTAMWGCRQCEQDFCQSCSERNLQAPKCLLGHSCSLFITDEDGWICDICQEEQAQGEELWACRLCEQDFCTSCAANMQAPKPPECPEGHLCESFITSEYGWICDICNEEQVERTEMWGCRQCEFDACMRCAAFKVASGGTWGETAV